MSNNNDNSGSAAIAFVFGGLIFMGLFLYALAAFFALVLTIVSICAWHKPRRFLGHIIYPHEAHAFVRNGIAGTFLLPAFVTFAEILFKFQIDPDYWPHVLIAGYTLGSIGISAMQDEDEPAPPPMREVNPPSYVMPPQARMELPPPEPFRFAQWDDEEPR
jgi:hypothetical protein